MKKRSIKNTRINTQVQRELSNILRSGIKDPRVAPWTSVVAVEVAPDMKTSKAYISVFGNEKRNTPEIRFVLDQSIEYGVNMSKKIDEVTKDLKTEGEEDA